MKINTYAKQVNGRLRFDTRVSDEEFNDLKDKLDATLLAALRMLCLKPIRWDVTRLNEPTFAGYLIEGTARKTEIVCTPL